MCSGLPVGSIRRKKHYCRSYQYLAKVEIVNECVIETVRGGTIHLKNIEDEGGDFDLALYYPVGA